jgi:biopolymer transport protein TolR
MPAVVSRTGSRRRAVSEINMVPFIDVMLVLLIIFMVSAPLITTAVVDLPSVGRAKAAAKLVVEVVVGADERVKLRIDGKEVADGIALPDLAQRVRQAQQGVHDAPVLIAADRNVKYESVVKVMDRLHQAGVARVGLAVKSTGV